MPIIDYEKARDDLRNAELAYDHATANAELHSERLSFELRASEFEVNRQELMVDDQRRRVSELSIESPVGGIVGDMLVDQKGAVSRDTPVMAVVDLSRFEIDDDDSRKLRRRSCDRHGRRNSVWRATLRW